MNLAYENGDTSTVLDNGKRNNGNRTLCMSNIGTENTPLGGVAGVGLVELAQYLG